MTEVPSLCASATEPNRGAELIAGVDAALGTAFSSGDAANDGFPSTQLPIASSERLAAATSPRPTAMGQAFGGVERLGERVLFLDATFAVGVESSVERVAKSAFRRGFFGFVLIVLIVTLSVFIYYR